MASRVERLSKDRSCGAVEAVNSYHVRDMGEHSWLVECLKDVTKAHSAP